MRSYASAQALINAVFQICKIYYQELDTGKYKLKLKDLPAGPNNYKQTIIYNACFAQHQILGLHADRQLQSALDHLGRRHSPPYGHCQSRVAQDYTYPWVNRPDRPLP
ncbi:hypothetical protein DTO280E4_1284 [Paecilomyces variotii]|nr:hypothetical protein DTO280E4_1284 [Paecilomyces variotii]